MASDPTAGGAPAEMPVEPSDSSLDIPPKPESVSELQQLVEQLQAEKADLQDKQLRALAEAQNVRRRASRMSRRSASSASSASPATCCRWPTISAAPCRRCRPISSRSILRCAT
ncbi:MAG: hypothetical protein Q8L19_12170 [Reyranella sp.]|nr:hypothetical protein [Reyranella sp.]